MIEMNGKFADAKLYSDLAERKLIEQVYEMLEGKDLEDEKIRIMPDAHPGRSSCVGFTSTLKGSKIDVNKIGPDIGCGVSCYNLGDIDVDSAGLDDFIRNNIPFGSNVYNNRTVPKKVGRIVNSLTKALDLPTPTRYIQSFGTLGGGNHFISISIGEDADKYLTIHTGSRGFGYHTYSKWKSIMERGNTEEREKTIKKMKDAGLHQEIEEVLKDMPLIKNYLTGENTRKYFSHTAALVDYASRSRDDIAGKIMEFLELNPLDTTKIESIHNYIGTDGIVRKGAIAAYDKQKVVIPINVMDGIILATGKGNEDWNNSAPHGAGRTKSRTQAKEDINLEKVTAELEESGIWMKKIPADETHEAYRRIDEIMPLIEPTVKVDQRLRTVYNFQG